MGLAVTVTNPTQVSRTDGIHIFSRNFVRFCGNHHSILLLNWDWCEI